MSKVVLFPRGLFRRIALLLPLLSATGLQAEPVPAGDEMRQERQSYVQTVRRDGRNMKKAEAEALEQQLIRQPDDLDTRARLIGYYFYRGSTDLGRAETLKARLRHITWFIRNHPDSVLAGVPEATIDPAGHGLADKAGYETAGALWRAVTDDKEATRQSLLNAANFFRLHDKAEAERLLLRAGDPYSLGELYAMGAIRVTGMNQNGLISDLGSTRKDDAYSDHAIEALRQSSDRSLLEAATAFLLTRGAMVQAMAGAAGQPLEPPPVELAGELLARCAACGTWRLYYETKGMMATSQEERQALARKELALLEKERRAAPPASSQQGRDWQLGETVRLAEVAFQAGDMEKAGAYAGELLQSVAGKTRDGMAGVATHKGHIILGRIALAQGDVKSASEHLLAAGDVLGGGALTSFGPNMALAKELLEHGKSDVVVAYLELCRRFWSAGEERLTAWIAEVRDGGIPEFGANLTY